MLARRLFDCLALLAAAALLLCRAGPAEAALAAFVAGVTAARAAMEEETVT